MSVAETDKTGKLSHLLGSLLSFIEGGTHWLLSFPEQATGNESVSSTMLYGTAISGRSRLRRERGAEYPVKQPPALSCINRKHFEFHLLPVFVARSPLISDTLRTGQPGALALDP